MDNHPSFGGDGGGHYKNSMKSLLIETQYLAPIATFQALKSCDGNLTLESCENYQKRSFRNRCDIATANGVLSLTIPLQSGKNAQLNIKAVRIANVERWQTQHWQAIKSAYGRAPFFEYYADYFHPFFEQRQDFLFDFNYALMEKIRQLLKIGGITTTTTDYLAQYSATEILDKRNQITKRLLEDSHFAKYPQLFEDKHGFISNLSILDLLCCMGPYAKDYF